jgi:hypothetical protein
MNTFDTGSSIFHDITEDISRLKVPSVGLRLTRQVAREQLQAKLKANEKLIRGHRDILDYLL